VSANVLGVSTAGVQRVVVDASGNVGIGTASPRKPLEVKGIAGSNALQSTDSADGTNFFRMYSDATSGSVINVNTGGVIRFAHSAENYASFTERMRIEASGNLLVGTAASATNTHQLQGTTNPAGTPVLYVRKPAVSLNNSGNSYIEFLAASSGFEGYIGVSGTTLQVIDASDSRKKENVRPANYGLKEIKALNPVSYDWKEEFGGEKNIKGFIAQEVEAVLPECVTTKDESENGGFADSKFLATGNMIPVLVKAIQELEARLAALESK
jgi:hypothetical protein